MIHTRQLIVVAQLGSEHALPMNTAGSKTSRLVLSLRSRWVQRIGRWVLATIFLYSAGAKLWDLDAFAVVIADYGLVFDAAVFATAVAIVLIEIAVGTSLLLRIRGSVAAATGLLGLFLAVLSYGLWLGLDIDCGCFGITGSTSGSTGLGAALGADLVLMVLCIYLLIAPTLPKAAPEFAPEEREPHIECAQTGKAR